MPVRTFALLAALAVTTVACGTKGPLYIPAPGSPAAKSKPAPAAPVRATDDNSRTSPGTSP